MHRPGHLREAKFKSYYPEFDVLNKTLCLPKPSLPNGDENEKVWYNLISCGDLWGSTMHEVIAYLSDPGYDGFGEYLSELLPSEARIDKTKHWWCKYLCTKNRPRLEQTLRLYMWSKLQPDPRMKFPPIKIHSTPTNLYYLVMNDKCCPNESYPQQLDGKRVSYVPCYTSKSLKLSEREREIAKRQGGWGLIMHVIENDISSTTGIRV